MPVYERDGMRVLFVHIPKTGGTSIEASFRRAGFAQSYLGSELTRYGCTPQHLTGANLLEEFHGLPFDYVFSIVRDPLTRFASERVWRAGHRAKAGKPVPGFEQFAQEWLVRQATDPGVGDNHFRPQVEFLLPGMDVFKYEEGLDNVLRRLARRLGYRKLGRVPPHKMAPRVDVDRSIESLSQATLAHLERLYVADFSVFGYSPPLSRPSRPSCVLMTSEEAAPAGGRARAQAWLSQARRGARHLVRS